LGPALGREPGYDDPDGACIVGADGKAPAIGWLRVPERKSAKNSLHIDIRVAGEGRWDMARRERMIRAKVPEVVARGATVVREEYDEGVLDHVVMLDPEGNGFYVAGTSEHVRTERPRNDELPFPGQRVPVTVAHRAWGTVWFKEGVVAPVAESEGRRV
jgi:hypothetical protein